MSDQFEKTEKSERHVVLVAPEVHWNTGNIGRTCLGGDAYLHLIKPLGFSLEDREVKRAGLDYWNRVKLSVWESFNHFLKGMQVKQEEIFLFSKSGNSLFWNMPVCRRMFLVFGSETKGLPEEILNQYDTSIFRIPISKDIRCLNLSTAVGIILFESLRTCLNNKDI